MRNLASIVTIENIQKMYQKDRIVCVTFKECEFEAISSNNINIGDKVAFIQEGSILPVQESFEFLRKRCFNEKLNGFLIKPMVMGAKDDNGAKGERVKSWGIVIPLNELGLEENVWKKFKAEDDITDILNIRKYEPEEDASPKNNTGKYPAWVKFCLKRAWLRWIGRIWQKFNQPISGNFPSEIISKSDETSLQNMKSIFERFADTEVNVCAKVEGQSCTIIPVFKGKKFVTAYPCSRNNAYPKENDSIFWKMMKKYDIIKKMEKLYKENKIAVIIQAEQVGPTIQNNIYDFSDNKLYVFTMKEYFTKEQLSYKNMVTVSALLGLDVVPIITSGIHKELFPDVKSAVDFAERVVFTPSQEKDKIVSFTVENLDKKLWKNYFQHEGIVVRSVYYDKDNGIGFSYKVKNLHNAEKGLSEIHKSVKDYKIEHKID